ncbi:hypothetical protein E4T42_04018 [Aureobasidium subglaciale]|nr:hypothetical protein E4T42_04018 [Aureobasidium subglaciale]
MAVPLTPLMAIKCSYDDCFHSFSTASEMTAHLKDAQIHPYYCGKDPGRERIARGFTKCDFHGKSWEDLVTHKVETMLPWIVGERSVEKPKKLNHIVCEFCGVDFDSLSGREIHRRRMHQAEHHIVCKGYSIIRDEDGNDRRDGCGSIFGRASQLVGHIEGGFCAFIQPMALRQDREHKRMIKLILDDPEGFKKNMMTMPYTPDQPPPKDIDDMSGGVTIDLLSQGDFSQGSGQQTLSPTSSATERSPFEDEWPHLPSLDINVDELSRSMRSFAVRSTSEVGSSFNHSESHYEDDIRPASNNATTESDDEDDTPPATPCPATPGPATPGKAWGVPGLSQKLFGQTKKKPILNWDGINAAHRRNKEEDDKDNIFVSHFWDPTHTDFKPEFFYRPDFNDDAIPPYQCPFESCTRRFTTPQKVGDHMRMSHAAQRNKCPMCGKNFEKLSALVAHFEASFSGAKCHVARSGDYHALLYEVTGGLLDAEKEPEQLIYNYRSEAGEEGPGVAKKINDKDSPWASEGNGVKDYTYRVNLPTRADLFRE